LKEIFLISPRAAVEGAEEELHHRGGVISLPTALLAEREVKISPKRRAQERARLQSENWKKRRGGGSTMSRVLKIVRKRNRGYLGKRRGALKTPSDT